MPEKKKKKSTKKSSSKKKTTSKKKKSTKKCSNKGCKGGWVISVSPNRVERPCPACNADGKTAKK